MTLATWTHPSPVGDLRLVASADGLRALLFADGHRHAAPPDPGVRRDRAPFTDVCARLDAWFAGEIRDLDVSLDPVGTTWQRRVWTALRAVPYGTTTTYGALAAGLGSPGAARAVGLANGRNPLCVVIPCHRVVGSGGSLTGYAGGLDRKRALLAHEADVLARAAVTAPA